MPNSQLAPEEVRRVLEERARALARPLDRPSPGAELELISFALANETYAVESRQVAAVFRLADLTPLPGAEPPITGVTAWRGELLVILDLRMLLGLRTAALNDLGRVIVLGAGRPAFGILADLVHGLLTVAADAIVEPPDRPGANRAYLRGVTRDGVLVLDGERLLSLQQT